MEMRIPDGDHKKRRYQVVAMKPIDHSEPAETNSKYEPHKDYADKPLDTRSSAQKTGVKTPTDPPSSSPQ
jgi:hypothetical protein